MGLVSLRSNLAINGTPERYNPQGKLGDLPPGASQLDFDGALPPTPDYFTGPQPSEGQEVVTTLGVTGTPEKYDAVGILGSLPPGSSQLNFDGALPAPVDFITNTNAKGFTIGMNTTQFKKKGQTSRLGFAAPLPAPVDFFLNNNARGFTLNMNSSRFRNQGQTSQLGFPGPIPSAQDFFLNTHANGFTIRMNSTQFKNDGQTSQFGFTGALPAPVDFFLNTHANGFVLRTPSLVTQYIDPGNSSIFGFTGALPAPVDFFTNNHANGFTIQAPIGITQFTDPGNSSIYGWQGGSQGAPEVDFFFNKNRFGFKKFQPVGISYYINNGQTSIHGFPGALPSPVDYFTNDHAAGFTLRAPVGVTQFAFDGQTSIYGFPGKEPAPVDFFLNTNAKGFTIKNPYGVTQFLGVGGAGTTYINPSGLNALRTVDYFQDPFSGAKGFKDRLAPYETGYIGISADSTKYQYPDTVAGGRLLNVRLGQGAGTAKLENQLGNGSKMGNTGFYAENRYSEAIRNDSNQSLLASWALRRRSPSPLEQQYSKFKLRDEAFNPTFIAQPLILRGLQNPDVLNPQRWGIDALGQQEGRTAANNIVAAIDGGFIRGGASTALERSAIDTARIAKFLASPKGLVWSITQVGLGKSNPLVETHPLNALPFNDTRSHSGLSVLLSVPGSAFGSHFTRHGIPFANELASYEQVIRHQTENWSSHAPGKYETTNNRLAKLKKELLGAVQDSGVTTGLLASAQRLSDAIKGSENPIIQTLSGLGGPNSVYGIGATNIRRYVDTSLKKQMEAVNPDVVSELFTLGTFYDKISAPAPDLSTGKYHILRQYAPTFNQNRTTQGGVVIDKQNALKLSPSTLDWSPSFAAPPHILQRNTVARLLWNLQDVTSDTRFDEWTPGNGQFTPEDSRTSLNEVVPEKLNLITGNSHASLPYNEIRALAKSRNAKTTIINDFRTKLRTDRVDTKTFSTDPAIANYDAQNLHDRYGFGDQGSTKDIDRGNPYSIKNNKNEDVGNIDGTIEMLNDVNNKDKRFALATSKHFRGDKINAIDYIPSTDAKSKTELYPRNTRDFIKFYFSGINMYDTFSDDAIVFRSTIKGLSDSFSPGWNTVSIMGRPDGPAIYTSFERNIGFQFTVAATAREELVPMWRKLNYLASYTMPIYGSGRPGGALCRLTLGDMFVNTPGYFTGLTITVNDEASWDLADDKIARTEFNIGAENTLRRVKTNKYAKQLPNLIDVDVQFKIIHDWRPEKGGRVYSLYNSNFSTPDSEGNWLWDSSL